VPHGKEASISQLLRRHSYVVSLEAPVDGQLSVAWYTVGSRKARSVLVAAGRITLTQHRAGKLTIKLTARGRALLSGARRLKLVARGTLAPAGRAKLTANRTFTLKR
jgi:hypothetical protein